MSYPNGWPEQDQHSARIAGVEESERTQTHESGSAPPGNAYDSFQSLRQAHLFLRESCLSSKRSGSSQATTSKDAASEIRAFIAKCQATGAVLTDPHERRAAQEIIYYWGAELAASRAAVASDFVPVLLAPAQSASPAEAPSEASMNIKLDDRSRDMIRLAAAARLWRDSGRKDDYLAVGTQIDDAAKFADMDRDIEEWVAASKQFSDQQRSSRRKVISVSVGAVAVVIALGVIFRIAAPKVIDWAITSELRCNAGEFACRNESSLKNNLVWIRGLAQPVLPPFDLSGVVLLNVQPRRLTAPNFSRAQLFALHFSEMDLQRASFQEARIQGDSEFVNARLGLADFRGTNIESTSFSNADLYRTAFDNACLKDVKFFGANFRLASFWSVKIVPDYRGFENTAWWFASGWNSTQIAELVKLDQGSLGRTKVFTDRKRQLDDDSRWKYAGTLDRAEALNALAWILASWGIDITKSADPKDANQKTSTGKEPELTCAGDVMQWIDVPTNALDAAEQAVCIVKTLNKARVQGEEIDLANLEDTRAYILMQTPGRMAGAAKIYRGEISNPTSEMLFRYAVAQHAIGDSTGASTNLKKSFEQNYVPGHELQHLRNYIDGTFRKEVYDYLDRIWPSRPNCGQSPVVQDY